MTQYILALDQGTTSSRAIVFGRDGRALAMRQKEFRQILPSPGHVEHDPEEIWETQRTMAREAIDAANISAKDVAAIGVTNQRETVVLWERSTGRPVANAIVWQSRISAPLCEQLKTDGLEPMVRAKTGLVLDAYFSASKVAHLLSVHDGLRARCEEGDILFGTIDTYLIWRLTGGRVHVTDYSNASRTLLFNIHTLDWDDDLLELFGVPRAMLPEVRPSSQIYGETDALLCGETIPIAGAAGDQQAATFGQACFEPGAAKNTYGTGCFLLMNTGDKPVPSENQLLTTIGWGLEGKITYCLEGSVFIAGAAIQWLRDGLKLIQTSSEVEQLLDSAPDSGGVYFVPAFVGLGAPHWDPFARGAIFGLTRGTTAGNLAWAAVESMAFQTRELIEAMERDASVQLKSLRVDGGATVNARLLQFQADLLDKPVLRPVVAETTALGAAYLAGLAVGYWDNLDDVRRNWALDREFTPRMKDVDRGARFARWQRAIARARDWDR